MNFQFKNQKYFRIFLCRRPEKMRKKTYTWHTFINHNRNGYESRKRHNAHAVSLTAEPTRRITLWNKNKLICAIRANDEYVLCRLSSSIHFTSCMHNAFDVCAHVNRIKSHKLWFIILILISTNTHTHKQQWKREKRSGKKTQRMEKQTEENDDKIGKHFFLLLLGSLVCMWSRVSLVNDKNAAAEWREIWCRRVNAYGKWNDN